MAIGKIIQTNTLVTVSVETDGQEKNSVNTEVQKNCSMQQDFQVNIAATPQEKLVDLLNMLQQRQNAIQTLPEALRQVVQQLLQQTCASQFDLSQGLADMLKAQKNVAEQLANLGSSLENAALLQAPENQEVQEYIAQSRETFAQGQPAEQSGNLLRMAGQLADQPAPDRNNLQTVLQQFVQKYIPETGQNMLQEPETLAQLNKTLAESMPQVIQQAAQKWNLPEIKLVWNLLKAAGAWQYQDLNKEQLQQAANTVRQLAQLLTQTTEGAYNSAQLETLIDSLPEELLPVLQNALNLGKPGENLQTVADNLETMAQLQEALQLPVEAGPATEEQPNAEQSAALQKTLDDLVKSSNGKAAFDNPANELLKVAKQFLDNSDTAKELQTLVGHLQEELLPEEGKQEDRTAPLNKLADLLQQATPGTITETANKYKLPELPKVWVLLKGMETEGWQNLNKQDLAKAATTLRELAQQVYKPADWQSTKQNDHSTLSFATPLYVGEGVAYPAYIHLYHQREQDNGTGSSRSFETWLRISLATENLGTVNTVFRLYDRDKLDVRVGIANAEGVDAFSKGLGGIREKLDSGQLKLQDMLVNRI